MPQPVAGQANARRASLGAGPLGSCADARALPGLPCKGDAHRHASRRPAAAPAHALREQHPQAHEQYLLDFTPFEAGGRPCLPISRE